MDYGRAHNIPLVCGDEGVPFLNQVGSIGLIKWWLAIRKLTEEMISYAKQHELGNP